MSTAIFEMLERYLHLHFYFYIQSREKTRQSIESCSRRYTFSSLRSFINM